MQPCRQTHVKCIDDYIRFVFDVVLNILQVYVFADESVCARICVSLLKVTTAYKLYFLHIIYITHTFIG